MYFLFTNQSNFQKITKVCPPSAFQLLKLQTTVCAQISIPLFRTFLDLVVFSIGIDCSSPSACAIIFQTGKGFLHKVGEIVPLGVFAGRTGTSLTGTVDRHGKINSRECIYESTEHLKTFTLDIIQLHQLRKAASFLGDSLKQSCCTLNPSKLKFYNGGIYSILYYDHYSKLVCRKLV